MLIRKYRAKNLQDCLSQVKADLGLHATILNTRTRRSGFLSKEFELEVTAALPSLQMPAAALQKRQLKQKKIVVEKPEEAKPKPQPEEVVMQQEDKLPRPEKSLFKTPSWAATPTASAPLVSSVYRRSAGVSTTPQRSHAPRSSTAAPGLGKQVWQKKENTPSIDTNQLASILDPLQSEIRALHAKMENMARSAKSTDDGRTSIKELSDLLSNMNKSHDDEPQIIRNLRQRLEKSGMRSSLVNHILEQVTADLPDDPQEARLCVNILARRLIQRGTHCRDALEMNTNLSGRKTVRIAALVGPPGVGKTTTLAKIAARAALIHGRKVAIIGTDMMRIGAIQQLEATAKAIGVPCHAAHNKADFVRSVSHFSKNSELILIDSGGQSAKETRGIGILGEMLSEARAEAHLLINADIRCMEMDCALNAFAALNPQSLIFTKIDQAFGLGGLYNALRSCELPVMYLTNGQKIPDDIEIAKPERIASLIMGVQYN
ncbi:MAG: GTP-binding protein [Pseudomonadota bacterium]